MAIYLTELEIKNYRSFGDQEAIFSGLKDINIFIGQNNVGKSNVLNFLSELPSRMRGSQNTYKITDHHKNNIDNMIGTSISVPEPDNPISQLGIQSMGRFFKNMKWVGSRFETDDSFVRRSSISELMAYTQEVKQTTNSDKVQSINIVENEQAFLNLFALPNSRLIAQNPVSIDQKAIRDSLYPIWNHGPANTKQSKPIKQALRSFIEVALNREFDFQFEESDTFSIEYKDTDDDIVPFDNLGSGIKQAISLGINIANITDSIVLIDEPELNMHPSLLRKLLKVIFSNTSNQYFIATHSNVLLDESYDKTVFQLTMANGTTQAEKCVDLQQTRGLLDDLGVKASDLLQTNGVIWVEGPSDRHYILKWLELRGSNYKEGFDFTFQYYGGKLLAHYAFDDDLTDFINMLNINKHAYIVMDSDWHNNDIGWTENDLADRKKRVIEEAKIKSINYWVTAGTEIENYVPDRIWTSYAGDSVTLPKYGNVTKIISKYTNKALESRKVSNVLTSDDLDSYDLLAKVDILLQDISSWNN